MDKIETLNFHEEKEVNGIKFWAYNAGHVLGKDQLEMQQNVFLNHVTDTCFPHHVKNTCFPTTWLTRVCKKLSFSGAAMFMIEIAGVRTLYTGDFSREEDRHLMAAELPTIKVWPVFVQILTKMLPDLVEFVQKLATHKAGRSHRRVDVRHAHSREARGQGEQVCCLTVTHEG